MFPVEGPTWCDIRGPRLGWGGGRFDGECCIGRSFTFCPFQPLVLIGVSFHETICCCPTGPIGCSTVVEVGSQRGG